MSNQKYGDFYNSDTDTYSVSELVTGPLTTDKEWVVETLTTIMDDLSTLLEDTLDMDGITKENFDDLVEIYDMTTTLIKDLQEK
jgi:uncharacterized protein YfkK (UPF0435 family)